MTMVNNETRDGATYQSPPDSATFLYDFVHVHAKFDAIINMAKLQDFAWIGSSAKKSVTDGVIYITKLHASGLFSKVVEVELGAPRRSQRSYIMPIAWRSLNSRFLFPTLDGDLEFLELDPGYIRIALRGSYLSPFGGIGVSIDRLLMHRVAESTVRSFLQDLASEIQARCLDL